MEVVGLDKIGKKMENKDFKFKIPKDLGYKERKAITHAICLKECPDGWKPDNYYNSQNSFFRKDNEEWARTTIRRWI